MYFIRIQAERKEEELKEWLEKRRDQRAEAKRIKEVQTYFTFIYLHYIYNSMHIYLID